MPGKIDIAAIVGDLTKKKIDVTLLSDETSPCVVSQWVPTGCMALDRIMGGGLPVGRMTEVYGDQATGKSLIAAQIVAMAQQLGIPSGYADSESAVSLDIMKAVGVDTDQLIYTSPDTVEETFEFFHSCIESKKARFPDATMVLVWDSVAATSVEMEMNADFGKAMMGRHAATISQAMRKITREFAANNIAALFLNQTRQSIGIMFGDSTTTFGGKAIGFHASIRIQLKLAGKIKTSKNKVVGVNTRAIVTKNKVAVPFQEAILPIYFGHGIDDASAALEWLIDNEIALKAGSYISILLGGQEHKFRRSQWSALYDKYYDNISDLIFADTNIDGEVEVEEV